MDKSFGTNLIFYFGAFLIETFKNLNIYLMPKDWFIIDGVS
jgi:hypothetical protein